ncbi:glycoside hydrolase family 32 protein [Clostridium polynesiense]|uniref:glycoside hydrolase family 32 protein n=1 Tax=Clostridium polynesiense TaxID=1325933 RepID=UPI00058D6456|nr:sucrose-6-phosphate hydrolase [Clostridium polynesiense]
MNREQELLNRAHKEINENKKLVEKDCFRQKYHIQPPVGFLNDPNGFIEFNGEYHVFYQFNPFYPGEKMVYWAHVKSRDLINWEELPIALAPSEWYEKNGCYSGSAVKNKGVLTLMYTGNVLDEERNREAYQCLAESTDGVKFIKHSSNPVIDKQPSGFTAHFRDPKLWQKNGLWYMVIGAQTDKEEGRVLLYKSRDLLNWDFVGATAGSNMEGLEDFGYMWECPNLFNMEDKDILICCPQGVEPQGLLYNNLFQCGYLAGKLDYSSGVLKHKGFTEMDRGFEFYAPQITEDSKNRVLLIGWMGMPGDVHPTEKFRWMHCLTIPRELKLIGEKLHQSPVEELKSLRKEEIAYNHVTITDEEIQLENISGNNFELEIIIEEIDAEEFGIKLRTSKSKDEYTLLNYSRDKKLIILDRNKSGKNLKGIRGCRLSNELKSLRIFSDNSSVEIFVNNGEEVFTSRVFPDMLSTDIWFLSNNGRVNIKSVRKWEI